MEYVLLHFYIEKWIIQNILFINMLRYLYYPTSGVHVYVSLRLLSTADGCLKIGIKHKAI